MFEAIHKETGEIFNLFKLGKNPDNTINFLLSSCDQKLLLCPLCFEPVTMQQAEHKIWLFVCGSSKCKIPDFEDDAQRDEFQRKEEDYYNPKHYIDDDDY